MTHEWFIYYLRWLHLIFTWYSFVCILATITRDHRQQDKVITLFSK